MSTGYHGCLLQSVFGCKISKFYKTITLREIWVLSISVLFSVAGPLYGKEVLAEKYQKKTRTFLRVELQRF